MARLVRFEKTGPVKIDPATLPPGKMLWLCACGLSKQFPICDGTHKTTAQAEQPGTLCVYDPATKALVETRPDQPSL